MLQVPLVNAGHMVHFSELPRTQETLSRGLDLQNRCFNVLPGVKICLIGILLDLIKFLTLWESRSVVYGNVKLTKLDGDFFWEGALFGFLKARDPGNYFVPGAYPLAAKNVVILQDPKTPVLLSCRNLKPLHI